MCRNRKGHCCFHPCHPPHAHTSRAADTDRRRYPWGTFILLTPSRSFFCWLEADWLVDSGESLECLYLWLWPHLHLQQLICTSPMPACTEVLKHTCMWRKSRPTEWGQGDFFYSSDTWTSAHWACTVGGSVQGYSWALRHCWIGFMAAAFPSQSLSPDFC